MLAKHHHACVDAYRQTVATTPLFSLLLWESCFGAHLRDRTAQHAAHTCTIATNKMHGGIRTVASCGV